ncbi:TetR/AcrR family transcriptional regulator [Agromyces albus]|uniref:TetR/AcrR family transcriptional regulator n=1 Tax=Agromyces albus TaxID=205332 RepID=UPI00278B7A70|nr:TetR/AcrR family transcriptional regulator [Agromyces albus]MDQ0574960.1 AcrR family transcriptional regulator [Agromyces albus]
MPTPERTSLDGIVSAGRALLESDGLDGLTMQAVAARVGVRAPSLYKRVRNRDELIRLIAHATLRELATRLEGAVNGAADDPRTELRQLAGVARAFAHERPAGFRLIFGAEVRLDEASLAASSAPVLRVAAALAGERDALQAARTFTAWLNGFVSMELAGAFRLGGDVEHAFEYGVERIADAVASPAAG